MVLQSVVLAGFAVLAGASISNALLTGSPHTEVRSKIYNETGLRYVKNSGICETTPGVEQLSGYIDVGTNMSMWFWFFESRNSPETAPFTLWVNGGPACSSMIGLFQENGPCHVTPDGNATFLNPYSWNNVSNVIYIDQPIGTGFSYGTEVANSTESAAPFVWTAFQVLFESKQFSKYSSREFIFGTESFGGHYGPSFVTYFEQQNSLIAQGTLKGEPIVVSAMMINNGWYDPLIQYKSFLDFARYAPGYGQLQNDTVLKNLTEAYYGPGGCLAQEEACYAAGNSTESNEICLNTDSYCTNYVYTPAAGVYDPYDLRQFANSSSIFPPEYYVQYLQKKDVMERIGAETEYAECDVPPYNLFVTTGDNARSWLPQLSALANSGMKILVWAGDADIICNWLGGHAVALAMDWYGNETLHSTPFTNMTLNGSPVAAVQNVDNFTFARVYGAGHEVAAFQPAAALAIFTQVVNKEPLHSV